MVHFGTLASKQKTGVNKMKNENENKVNGTANGTAAADNGAPCVSESALNIAESAAGVRYLFPVRSNAEIGTDKECRINGFSELWSALNGDDGTTIAELIRGALKGATDFNLMPIGRARRSNSGVISYTTDDETPKGIMAATAFCLWVKIGTEWKLLSNVLDAVGIAIPATVALKNGRKFRNRLRKLVLKGMAYADIIEEEKSESKRKNGKPSTEDKLNEALAQLRELQRENAALKSEMTAALTK